MKKKKLNRLSIDKQLISKIGQRGILGGYRSRGGGAGMSCIACPGGGGGGTEGGSRCKCK